MSVFKDLSADKAKYQNGLRISCINMQESM